MTVYPHAPSKRTGTAGLNKLKYADGSLTKVITIGFKTVSIAVPGVPLLPAYK